MKANKKFVEGNEEGVSAVIGVILMVAITVAIAATVYVYVSGMMGGAAEKAPTITFTKDESANTLTVVQADPGIGWEDIYMLAQNTTSPTAGGTWIIDGGTVGGTWAGQGMGINVIAGDTISFDPADGNLTSGADITIRFSYTPVNALIGTYKLSNL